MDKTRLAEIINLPSPMCRQQLDKEDRAVIGRDIQPWVERNFLEGSEVVESFEVEGCGLDKTIRWRIVASSECDGCYGIGRISSNRGTRTECPDCDGEGKLYDGEVREIVTDFDGDVLLEGRMPSKAIAA